MDARAELDAYLDLTNEEIARIVLALLVEELLARRLSAFRDYLPAQPREGFEEFGFRRDDVMPICHVLR